jgi:uncharacterized membrane protein
MRKIILLIFIFLGIFFSQQVLAQEKIDNFDVTIKINSDASLELRERIEYDFGSTQRHGIFRDIPIKYQTASGNLNLSISDIYVIDQNGNPYQFDESFPGQNIQIKIGDPDKFVSGKKIYVINYKIKRAVNYFNDHDELYWNVTGNQWPVPIENSSAKVILPQKIKKDEIQAACFAGSLGEKTPCLDIAYESDADNLINVINFKQPKSLTKNQGLTIVIGFPKGVLTKPSLAKNILNIIADNWIVVLPIITFFVMLYLWYSRGRDPKGRGTIIPQYDPPDNLTPAEIGVLIDEKINPKDISSEIIYLATKGYIKITRIKNENLIFKQEDYLLEKLKEADDLSPFDKKLMDGLFGRGDYRSTKLSDLKKIFYKELPEIHKKIYDSLVSKNYFPETPVKIKRKYFLIGILFLVLAYLIFKVIISASYHLGIVGIGSLAASGILIILFGSIMPVKTKKGVEAKENIFGLREYLEVAEKDRIKFHNAPEKNPDHFEKLLPYAMVLGVERQWAEQFKDIYNQPPSWYADPSTGVFNSTILINGLNNFSHSANNTLVSAPRGGSGLGGGGFSGGGFGGGGGGSW